MKAQSHTGFTERSTDTVTVESPYGGQHLPDRPERIRSPIRQMRLEPRELAAAEQYCRLAEMSPDGIRCALDQFGGGSFGSKTHSDARLLATTRLKEADRLLGFRCCRVIRLIVVQEIGVEEVARRLHHIKRGTRPHRYYVKKVSKLVREGLQRLADHWWPERGLRTVRPLSAVPTGSRAGKIQEAELNGRVAHASPGAIYGYEPEGGQPQKVKRRCAT